MSENKTMVILRGLPGNGKSLLAAHLTENGGVICCADDFLTDKDGNYVWNDTLAYNAHMSCQNKCVKAIEEGISPIVIANTNVKLRDVNFYKNLGEHAGYIVHVVVVENHHSNKSSHDVPEDTMVRMEHALKSSIKLR